MLPAASACPYPECTQQLVGLHWIEMINSMHFLFFNNIDSAVNKHNIISLYW